MEDLTPLYNKEFYLAYLCGEDVVLPIPDGNTERYLAYLCGMDVTIPDVPDGRTETYLAYKCGEDVVLPDPLYRIEFYLAKWCGMDVEVPEPLYRIEYWLAQLANSGELKTVTGNPISVSDALAKPAESLTIEILPKQDLHGYDNPWPAGGGTNKFNEQLTIGILNSDGTVSESYSRLVSDFIPVVPGETYAFVWPSTYGRGRGAFYDANKDLVQYEADFPPPTIETNVSIFTVPNGAYYLRFNLTSSYGTTYNHDVSINYPSTDHSYHPYSNICPISGFTGVNIYHESAYDGDDEPAYAITWQTEAGTVYGGSLDVVSGVMTVSKGYIDLVGGNEATYSANGATANTSRALVTISGKANGESNMISNMFHYSGKDSVGNMAGRATSNNVEFNLPTTVSQTAEDIKAWFASNNTQVAYELATPQTIQLTPTQVDMLLGNNTIWNDVGDMTLEYLADGPADDADALNILLNNRYVNNGEPDEATDKEALEILLGGNTR